MRGAVVLGACATSLALLFSCATSMDRSMEKIEQSFETVESGRLPPGWRAVQGEWGVRDGRLEADGQGAPAILEFASGAWSDVAVEVDVTVLAADPEGLSASILFGAEGPFGVEGDAPRHHVAKVRSVRDARRGVEYGCRTPGGSYGARSAGPTATGLDGSVSRRLRLVTCRGRVQISIDGRLVLDSPFGYDVRAGGLGLRIANGRAAFDSLEVVPLHETEVARLAVSYGPMRRVLNIAHRGSSRSAPENTLVAIRRGVEEGAVGAEFDVYRTADGEIVLMHDKSLLRTTNFRDVMPDAASSLVHDQSFADLSKLDAGSWKGPEFRGEPIPTLKETLEYLRGRATPVLEIKPGDIGRDVARVVRETGAETEVFVQSFSARAIREFREELPTVTTGYITGAIVSGDAVARAREHIRIAREAGANAIVCDHRLVVPEYVEELHRRALSLFVWTVDDVHVMECLVRLGVDGIITNVPARLTELLQGL